MNRNVMCTFESEENLCDLLRSCESDSNLHRKDTIEFSVCGVSLAKFDDTGNTKCGKEYYRDPPKEVDSTALSIIR